MVSFQFLHIYGDITFSKSWGECFIIQTINVNLDLFRQTCSCFLACRLTYLFVTREKISIWNFRVLMSINYECCYYYGKLLLLLAFI